MPDEVCSEKVEADGKFRLIVWRGGAVRVRLFPGGKGTRIDKTVQVVLGGKIRLDFRSR